jgi:hypothetical protein
MVTRTIAGKRPLKALARTVTELRSRNVLLHCPALTNAAFTSPQMPAFNRGQNGRDRGDA